MREKGKFKKDKKILIRVDKTEKALSEKLSKAAGMNTSQFFRGLLRDTERKQSQEKDIDKAVDKAFKKYRRRK